MDLMKIGRYIAEKRKALGMTQRQLAEKLGMSDKSVSKWERGICLPDVSVYFELCSILGISINEFLAGEDILAERMIEKAEENIVQITKESKRKEKRSRGMIIMLAALFAMILAVAAGWIIYMNRPQNSIAPMERNSLEMKTAEILSGPDGAWMYRFVTTDTFQSLNIYVSEYRAGKLISKENLELSYEEIGSPQNGMLLILPDFESFSVRLILVDEGARLSTEIPILQEAEGRQWYGRSSTQITENTPIRYGEEQGIMALIYGKKEIRIGCIQEYEQGIASPVNDYVYYFSVQFCKEN